MRPVSQHKGKEADMKRSKPIFGFSVLVKKCSNLLRRLEEMYKYKSKLNKTLDQFLESYIILRES